MTACCPCDDPSIVCVPSIAAGLPALPRQIAGFPEYRRAMLHDIPDFPPLSVWRAREGDDLGIMLLEMWAYVLDILGFYDERIANETYLRTAVLPPSVRKVVGLIGYQPRPALAASVILAAIADGSQPVILPPRTGFRSDAFSGQPPQIFETESEFTIHPLKNQWTIAPVREKTIGPELLLDVATVTLSVGHIALLRAGTALNAGRVLSLDKLSGRDGVTYKKLVLDPAPTVPESLTLDSTQLLAPVKTAGVNSFPPRFGTAHEPPKPQPDIVLDAIYSDISEKEFVVVQRGRNLLATKVTTVVTGKAIIPPPGPTFPSTTVPATQITIDPPVPADWASDPKRLIVNFGAITGGRLTRVGKAELNVDDFAPPGLPLDGVQEPLPEGVGKPGELLLLDAQDNGDLANGSVDISADGQGSAFLSTATALFEPSLRTPVSVFGNLVATTRGESVLNEQLGRGDASQAFQYFNLAKKPLTYINDAAAPDGRRATLQVRVNGIQWTEVGSFFGAGPHSEVYTVRQNDDGESIIRFGDGVTGARLPTGVNNVTATYRFGAGAAKPPAGAIGQIAKPVIGLRRVVSPVAAGGGADGDQPKDVRRNAPASALLLGRAVSVPDFEALAREFGGVINAHAEWAWDETQQNAVVKVTFISDGGDVASKLRAFLIGFADPNTPLVAIEAKPQPSLMVIDLEVDPRFSSETVAEQAIQALTNVDTGLLAKQNIPIGLPLFRSRIFDAVLSIHGARSVRVMTVDGQPAPFAITVAADRYRDFLDALIVEGAA
jgi:hypothetical protein